MRALVIDDSRTIRTIIGKILREIGMDVIEASNGLQALRANQAASRRRIGSRRLEHARDEWARFHQGHSLPVRLRQSPHPDGDLGDRD